VICWRILTLSPRDLRLIFELAERLKASPRDYAQALQGKQLALIFEKPSLRAPGSLLKSG